jgi:large subunit ribosomal protein L29
MNSINKLKELDLEGLKTALVSSREEQFRLRFKKSRGDLNQTHLLKSVKTVIAQIKTLISQKEEVNNV